MKRITSFLIILSLLLIPFGTGYAHPGRTDSNGGHWVRTPGWGYPVGTYHYHNGGSSSPYSGYGGGSSVEEAVIPDYALVINSAQINNINAEYPIFTYNDIIYIPMTTGLCWVLGIDIQWDDSTGLSLKKTTVPTNTYLIWDENKDSNYYPGRTLNVKSPDFTIKVNGSTVFNSIQQYPFLEYKGITYLPLTSANLNKFGLSMRWNEDTGLILWR